MSSLPTSQLAAAAPNGAPESGAPQSGAGTQPPASSSNTPAPASTPAAAPSPTFSPLYQQIKALIMQSLQTGEWKPGEMIPSEMDLAAR